MSAKVFSAVLALCLTAPSLAIASPLAKASPNDNRRPAGRLENGVLTLNLEVREALWFPRRTAEQEGRSAELRGGIRVWAFAEQGHEPQMPGPLIRVPQGTELQVAIHNGSPGPVFVHGLHQHPGVAKDTIEIASGATRQVRFLAGQSGSYIYWASTAKEPQTTDGTLAGAFIVDPPDAKAADRVFVIQLWASHVYEPTFQAELAINGATWPDTERLQAQVGHAERWRILNATPIVHPMHLHGFYFYVDAVGDGESDHLYTEAERRMAVTETLLPGSTFAMTWTPERSGNWLFHCHILDHMSGYYAPVLYGPSGTPAGSQAAHGSHKDDGMGMAKLVLGINVRDDPNRVARPSAPAATETRRLFVRERAASAYVPAGYGFYLEGVSRTVGPVGPPLVITRGARTAIVVTNQTKEPTAVHWHGIEIESYYDGVPGWTGSATQTTPPIAPGSSFVAYITPPRAGTFIYHTHWHDVRQLTGGLYGAVIVLPPGEKFDAVRDKVFLLGRGGPDEIHDPLTLNGLPQPAMMVVPAGEKYRFRFINITPTDAMVEVSLTSEGHPVQWRALAKDGADLPTQQATVRDAVQTISVGETCDFEFVPKHPGDYSLHFSSPLGSDVTQRIVVVPADSPFRVFASEVANR